MVRFVVYYARLIHSCVECMYLFVLGEVESQQAHKGSVVFQSVCIKCLS